MTNSAAICLLLFLSCVCFTYSTASADPQYECPTDYTFSKGDNTCLRNFVHHLTMERAREFCSSKYNGRVAEIKDDRTKEVFNGLMTGENTLYWVGIDRTNGSFHYISGDPMTNFLPWVSQPHGTEKHDCVLFDVEKGLLEEYDCKTSLYFMCQVDAEIPDPKARCPPFYTYSDGDASCLKAFSTRATLKEAVEICSSNHNGRIAEIRDSGTKDIFIRMASKMMGVPIWLGITRSSDGGRNEYMNGDPVTDVWSSLLYSKDSTGPCAQLEILFDPTPQKKFVGCDTTSRFICQTNDIVVDTTEPISMFLALRSIPGEFGKGKVFVYDVLVTNDGGDYNNDTGIYTAPVDGYYLFHYSILCDNDDYIYLDLKTNTGRLLNRLRAGDVGTGNEYSDAGVVAKLTKGEEIMPVIFSNDPRGMSLGYKEKPDVSNRFTGYLLRAI